MQNGARSVKSGQSEKKIEIGNEKELTFVEKLHGHMFRRLEGNDFEPLSFIDVPLNIASVRRLAIDRKKFDFTRFSPSFKGFSNCFLRFNFL